MLTVEQRLQKIEDEKEGNIPKDIYSLLHFEERGSELGFEWKALAYVLAVFLFQVTTLCLILANLLDYNNDLLNLPAFNPPADVTWVVRVSQYFALVIAVWTQEDLIECVDLFASGETWLYLSAIMKALVGGLGLVVSLVIVLQSDKIVDLFANFAAMAFVASVDNVLFPLTRNGFIMPSLSDRVKYLSMVDLEIVSHEKDCAKRCFFPGIIALLFAPLLYVQCSQQRGNYLPRSIDVYLGEDYYGYGVPLNGEYVTWNGMRLRGRPVYYEKDCLEACEKKFNTQECISNNCSSVSYCDHNWWAFPTCDVYAQIARSATTDSFDASLAPDWTVWHWSDLHVFSGALATDPSFSVTSNRCQANSDCNGEEETKCLSNNVCSCGPFLGARCQGITPCKILEVDIGRSFPDYNKSFSLLWNDGEETPVLLKGRPVYFSEASNAKHFEVLYFIGSRWLLTTSQNLDLEDDMEEFNTVLDKMRHAVENKYLTFEAAWNGGYLSQETFEYSPAGLSWNRLVPHEGVSNEKQEGGLFGKLEPVESFLLCKHCDIYNGYEDCDTCSGYGECNQDSFKCDCYDGRYGSKCHIAPIGQVRLQLTFEYKNSSKCFEATAFDPIPAGLDMASDFILDLVPPIRFAHGESQVGVKMIKNATRIEIYQASCNSVEGDALKTIDLPQNNNYTEFVLDHHSDLFEVNSSGVTVLSPMKHEHCSDETFSSTVPSVFSDFASGDIQCGDFGSEEDPKLQNLVRMLVTVTFDSPAKSPFQK